MAPNAKDLACCLQKGNFMNFKLLFFSFGLTVFCVTFASSGLFAQNNGDISSQLGFQVNEDLVKLRQNAVDKLFFSEKLGSFLDSDALKEFLANMNIFESLNQELEISNENFSKTVTFDNVNAPCSFQETEALRGVQEGIIFYALESDGGDILHECAGFGLEAASEPNFLAYNREAEYQDGGIPWLPQAMILPVDSPMVSMKISSGKSPGQQIAIIGLGQEKVQAVKEVSTSSAWETYSLQGAGKIRAIILFGFPDMLVVDDIEYYLN